MKLIHATNNNPTFQILQRQNKISELLIKQNASQLPLTEIPVLDGDPLNFSLFMNAFKHYEEDQRASKGDCLYYLKRYTRGRPRDLVQSCIHVTAERGFETAKALLKMTKIPVVHVSVVPPTVNTWWQSAVFCPRKGKNLHPLVMKRVG